jgi:2-enoate reductase
MKNNKFKKLFLPGYMGKLEIRNRIVMAPMVTIFADRDGAFSQRQVDYYAARARGGTGLIIVEGTRVENQVEHGFPPYPTNLAEPDSFIPAMNDLTEAVHDNGAKIGLQFTLGVGRVGWVGADKRPPISSSATPSFMNPSVTCRPMTIDEIKSIVVAAGMAARRAVFAGFDLIEVHAHTGYLLDQFMCSLWNKREDEYGGELDRRMRFPLEVIQSIRKNIGPNIPISFRFSAEHGIPGGRDIVESQEIARRLEGAGVDVLHVDAGCYERFDLLFPTIHAGDACLADQAALIKKVVGIPIIAVGNITPETGEGLLEKGGADFIASGRALIADPDWPNKVRTKDHGDDVRPCIRCNEYCVGRMFRQRPISCSVNPLVGKEGSLTIEKTRHPKRVLVIGGGPAGMEAARVAKLRGHEVTLMEKENILGGVLNAAAAPPFKGVIGQLIKWWVKQLDQLGVDVRLNTEASPQTVELLKPEAIVVATGGEPVIPDIPGIRGKNIIGIVDHHLGHKMVGESVIIAGGGLSGCEAALELIQEGKKVTIVEMLRNLAPEVNIVNGRNLIRLLTEHGVNILTGHKIKKFQSTGLIAEGPSGDVEVKADTVILAFGVKCPENTLAKVLEESTSEVYVIGDYLKPGQVGGAVRGGFLAGLKL